MKLLSLINSTIFLVLLPLFTACSYTPPPPVKLLHVSKKIDYIKDVKPILDKRCVVCHSCYNSPCQLKLSSFEGLDRGASKEAVYDATRISPVSPTRLFVDASTAEEWRKKGFFSVTQNSFSKEFSDSTLAYLLREKQNYPKMNGSYAPEDEKLICPQNAEEVSKYFDKKDHRGMPYGFPALSKEEHQTLMAWIEQGTKGPNQEEQKTLTTPSASASAMIQKWEEFFNNPDPKYVMSARYIYEHIFLAQIHFQADSNEYFELVRSRTPSPKSIEIIPTVRPYDNPNGAFFYRFRKITSTIVHKTHMIFTLDDNEFARVNELFIQPKWLEYPHVENYNQQISANPFLSFAQIPPRSRYQFLLDHSEYFIMNFIRGPVCRGQVALSSINDHFWVVFLDPTYDVAVNFPFFIQREAYNLATPVVNGSDPSLFAAFSNDYLARSRNYFTHKMKLYKEIKPQGLGYDSIWQGNNADDAPLLTIYRHHDSASVHKGALGDLPKTLWVIDYPLFERLYYSLVAGYDVFGNVAHQVNIRRYMDFLRFEGELNFITYMPKERQMDIFRSWSIGDPDMLSTEYHYISNSAIVYKTNDPKREFIETLVHNYFLKSENIAFDKINYYKAGEKPATLPSHFESKKDLYQAFKAISNPGTKFVEHLSDFDINIAFVKFEGDPKTKEKALYTSIILDRWHNNVNSLLNPDSALDKTKDRFEVHEQFIGSYPNIFIEVPFAKRKQFFDLVVNYTSTPYYNSLIKEFAVDRANPDFWNFYDDFQDHFDKEEPIQSGILDLNRYYPDPI